jgi:enamine deaminase RidA (YjgF/YER057c/UK114 family)
VTIKRLEAGPRMSQIVVHGTTAYLAGQIADDPVPSAAEQTKQVLAKIDRLLASVGSDKTKILSAIIWLSDMSHFNDMNGVWDAWAAGNPPARATVQSALARAPNIVEIMVIAAVD